MSSTRAQLLTAMQQYLKSNGSPSLTKAVDLRDFMTLVVAAYANILDDKDADGGYLGIDDDGIATVSKIKSLASSEFFLKDDGTFQNILDKVLTNFPGTPAAGEIDATKTILEALEMLQGKLALPELVGAVAKQMDPYGHYIANNVARVNFILPPVCLPGRTMRIHGRGAGGWRVSQAAGQIIYSSSGNTTLGVGGRIDSNNQYDSIEIMCLVADTDFKVVGNAGFTIV